MGEQFKLGHYPRQQVVRTGEARKSGLRCPCRSFTCRSRPGDNHLLVGKVASVAMRLQEVGTMDIAAVDPFHHERGQPLAQLLVEPNIVGTGLLGCKRPLEVTLRGWDLSR